MDAHAGQKTAGGKPYILHPVMLALDNELTTDLEKIVALLHDVMEDAPGYISWEEILDIFGHEVLVALECITHPKNEPRVEYWDRCKSNPIAFAVKKADVRHNSRPDRIVEFDNIHDRERLRKKYIEAKKALGME